MCPSHPNQELLKKTVSHRVQIWDTLFAILNLRRTSQVKIYLQAGVYSHWQEPPDVTGETPVAICSSLPRESS